MTRIPKNEDIKNIEAVRCIARAGHIGQTRKDRITPYFRHIDEVHQEVARQDGDVEEQMLAICHDLFEDNRKDVETFTRLIMRALPHNLATMLISRIHKISHNPDEDYDTYIRKVASDERCIRVKIIDIKNNLQGEPSDRKRQLYHIALEYLEPLREDPENQTN